MIATVTPPQIFAPRGGSTFRNSRLVTCFQAIKEIEGTGGLHPQPLLWPVVVLPAVVGGSAGRLG